MELIKPIPIDNITNVLHRYTELFQVYRAHPYDSTLEVSIDATSSLLTMILGIHAEQLHTALIAVIENKEVESDKRGEAMLTLLGLAK